MLKHLLVALLLTAITVVLHGVGSLILARMFADRRRASTEPLAPWQVVRRTVGLVSFLLLLHLIEASVWAECYWLMGLFPDMETAGYYSLTSYTTVGYGDVHLSSNWRMLGPIESGVGVLMFGWSIALMVAILGRDFGARFPADRKTR